ncbi:hypothetical protein A7X67_03195 [Clostridium sp. W14A]|nr:hypothetical protein A7X67_03195 [Clostridium sp. W14A]
MILPLSKSIFTEEIHIIHQRIIFLYFYAAGIYRCGQRRTQYDRVFFVCATYGSVRKYSIPFSIK